MRVAYGCVALVLLAVPVASATGVIGTEEDPELSDQVGDVNYSTLYTGDEDRDHVDIVSAWFEYDEFNDTVATVIKLVDLENVEEKVEEYGYFCQFVVPATVEGENAGHFYFFVGKSSETGEVEDSLMHFTPAGSSSARGIAHTLSVDRSEPGYYVFNASRPEMANQAQAIDGRLELSCGETYGVEGIQFSNGDDAQATAAYDLQTLTPNQNPNGVENPAAGPSSPSSPTSPAASSAAVGTLLTLVGLAAIAYLGKTRD